MIGEGGGGNLHIFQCGIFLLGFGLFGALKLLSASSRSSISRDVGANPLIASLLTVSVSFSRCNDLIQTIVL